MAVAPTTHAPSGQTGTTAPAPTSPQSANTSPPSAEPTPQPTEPTAVDILPQENRVNTDADVFDEIDDGFLGTQQPVPDTPAISSTTPIPAQPPVAPGAAPAEATAPDGTPPATTPPGDGTAALEEYRKNAVGKLESYFALDQAAADELTTDPVAAVPKLMARTMFETIQATMQAVHHFLPQMIEQQNVRQVAAKEAEDKFFGAWPKLDRKVHNEYIRQAAAIYRQMKPQASLDDIIRDVGAQTMVAFKIPAETPKAPWQKSQPTQATTPPHRPAAAAAPRTAPMESPKRNIFVEMANEFADGLHDD